MKKTLISLFVIFYMLSICLHAQEQNDLDAVEQKKKELTTYLFSLQNMKQEMSKRIGYEAADVHYNGPAISATIYAVSYIDNLLSNRPATADTLIEPLLDLKDLISRYQVLTDSIITLENELYSLQQIFSDQANVQIFQEKIKDRRNKLDEFEGIDLLLKSDMEKAFATCLNEINKEIDITNDNLKWLEEQKDIYLVVQGIADLNAGNMAKVIPNYYKKCSEYDQSGEQGIIAKLSYADTLLLSKFKNVEKGLSFEKSVQFYKDFLHILDDEKIDELEYISHVSPDSIISTLYKKCAATGLQSIRTTFVQKNLLPVAKASVTENSKTYSIKSPFLVRKDPVQKFEFDIFQIAALNPQERNTLKNLDEATEKDWQEFASWLGIDRLSLDEQVYIKALPKHRFMSTDYKAKLDNAQFGANNVYLKASNVQLKTMGVEDSGSFLRKHNNILHPRRLIFRAEASALGDYMQLDFPNYTLSQMGYGNYAYGFLLGYRFNFDTNAIARGSDQTSHYIGVKYLRQQIFPNVEYSADGETCTSCDELVGVPEITSLDWSSEEFHLIYAGNSAYIGFGLVDARFMIQSQAEHDDMPGLIIAEGEIDQQEKTSVLTLGLMKQSGNFSFDLYGRAYPPSKVFKEVSFSVGAGLAFQFFFLR